MDLDDIMHLLTAFSFFNAGHKDLFSGHKGKFLVQMILNLFRINNHLLGYIHKQFKDGVGE